MKLAIIGAGNVGGDAWRRLGAESRPRRFLRRHQSEIRQDTGARSHAGRQGSRRHGRRGGGVRRDDRADDAVAGGRGRHPFHGRLEWTNYSRCHQPAGDGPRWARARDRPRHFRGREGAGLGDRGIGVQDPQHHRLRQHGRSGVPRREVGDVRGRRRCRKQAQGHRAGRRARLRRDRRRAAAQCRLLEAHAMLWIELALKRGLGRDWAFARVTR